MDYPFVVHPLSQEDGGGYLITFPDLPGCMSDGETPEEALKNGRDAAHAWLETARAFGDPIPQPSTHSERESIPRFPESISRKLAAHAQQRKITIDDMVIAFVADALETQAGLSI